MSSCLVALGLVIPEVISWSFLSHSTEEVPYCAGREVNSQVKVKEAPLETLEELLAKMVIPGRKQLMSSYFWLCIKTESSNN